MKQIYYTFCQSFYSLNGRGGDQTRAASSGISDAVAALFKTKCFWHAPQKMLDFSPEDRLQLAPKALRYTKVSDQKILVHSVYALPDEETKREGNYFAHLLMKFPEDWNAKKALELWGSPFWQTCDSLDIPKILPDVQISDFLPGKINDETFLNFIQDSSHADLFRFLLQNWLVRKPDEYIVLCCKPEETAFCLWGLTRFLPQTYWESLTFSTYEKPREGLSYNVTTFSTMGETFPESEQIPINNLRMNPQVRLFPREAEPKEEELPFIADWIDEIQKGNWGKIQNLFKQVPENYYHDFGILNDFWKLKIKKKTNDLASPLKVPELYSAAEECVLAQDLKKAFEFLYQLNPEGQIKLLNLLLKQKTLNEIRENSQFRQPLIRVLNGEPLPLAPPSPKPASNGAVPVPKSTQEKKLPINQPSAKPKKSCFGAVLFLLIFLILVYISLLLVTSRFHSHLEKFQNTPAETNTQSEL
ncbi:MAG: hypothetical protein IJQ31_04365 [Thermoguttaceae bacterium]|nr:hypothetical protein [Thermoguttaceae bacterium]